MKKKICIVWESITDGGVNSYLRYLLSSKKLQKFKIVIITNSSNQGAKYLKNDLKKNKNIKFIYFKSFYVKKKILIQRYLEYFFKPIFFIKTVKLFDEIFEREKIDVLICQCGNYGGFRSEQSAIISAQKKKIEKIILVIHHKCEKYPLFFKTILKYINKKIRNSIDNLVTVSNATLKSIKENSNLYSKHKGAKVIHNGVKIESFKKKNYLTNILKDKKIRIKKNDILIGMLARVSHDKGQDDLIKSISLINPKILINTKFILIGRGNKKDVIVLKKLIKHYKLDNNIMIKDYLDINSQKILFSFDLLISATKDFEGFGLSIAESIIVGTPVIATKVGGVPEFFKNNF